MLSDTMRKNPDRRCAHRLLSFVGSRLPCLSLLDRSAVFITDYHFASGIFGRKLPFRLFSDEAN
ncbi:MAG TPA: hypothetical protein PLJ27_14375 [Polyangiaceae bacterium]|nr:hypothetical protein [Polyangiaceae bacterium]